MNVRAMVTHRESLDAAPEVFEALAQNRPGYVKALLYPNGEDRTGRIDPRTSKSTARHSQNY